MLEMHFIYLWFKNRIDFWKKIYLMRKDVENQFIRKKYPTPSERKFEDEFIEVRFVR